MDINTWVTSNGARVEIHTQTKADGDVSVEKVVLNGEEYRGPDVRRIFRDECRKKIKC